MSRLLVLMPGLLDPMPERVDVTDSPDCTLLEKWLACGRVKKTQASDFYAMLAQLFQQRPDYSLSQVSARIDNVEWTGSSHYRADPVHFKADMDHAILLDHHRLFITPEEAQSLVESFNRHFHDDGLFLHMGPAHRWYLSFKQPFEVQTTAVEKAVGRNVRHFLPAGHDALNWKRILNETQMLFHGHEVNQQRQQQGQLTINSLWLWGEGQDVNTRIDSEWQWLMSDNIIACGLASFAGVQTSALQNIHDDKQLLQGDGIIVLDQLLGPNSYGDVEAWKLAVKNSCHLLKQIHRLLVTGKIKQLIFYAGDDRLFELSRASLLKFWRRSRPVTDYVRA